MKSDGFGLATLREEGKSYDAFGNVGNGDTQEEI